MLVNGEHLQLKQLKEYLFGTSALHVLEDTLDWPSDSVGVVVLLLFSCFTAFQNFFAFAESR